MATIEDLKRIISIPLLLSLLSPFLALSCIIVFLYQRLILNDQECIEYRYHISRLYVGVVSEANFIITFLLTILGLRTDEIPFYILFTWMPVMGICLLFRTWVSNPFLLRFVPSLYDPWNSRIYQPLEDDTGPTSPASDSRRIRVVQILLGALVYETKVKINPVDWDTAIYDALSYTWGSYLMLRRVITVNDRTFLVTDSLFRALRQLRHTKETRLVSKSTHLVCVLLASDVPLLLQRSGDNESRVTGQAYVDGIMDYKGDLRQDIESGKIRLREFILR